MRSYKPTIKGSSGADQAGAGSYPEGGKADHLCRRRRHPGRRIGSADHLYARTRLSDHQYADGAGRLSGNRLAVARHARHARYLRSQYGHAPRGRGDRHRRALRRPRDRQYRKVLSQRENRAHGRRPRVDLQDGQGRRADRRSGRRYPQGFDRRAARSRASSPRSRAQGLVEADRGMALDGLPEVRPRERAYQAAVRDRAPPYADQGRRLS